ncbi:hypothetical protein RB594_006525 [Gaeumannomyces avenae]
MHAPTAAAALVAALAAPLAAATGTGSTPVARVLNKCSFPVTVWAVGSSVSPGYTLGAGGGTFAEGFARDPQTGGRALKVTRAPDGLYNGSPQLIFAYNLDVPNVWFDLSSVFGNALQGSNLVVASDEPSCPKIQWPQGSPPAGSQVKVCTASRSVTLTLCA